MWLPDNSVFVPVVDPNMASERTPAQLLEMAERLAGFDCVEQTYTADEAAAEAARCLKCPTQWCSKACPAGVRVTDFIAAARAGDFEGAYAKHKEMGCICFENPKMGIYFIEDPDGYWLEVLPKRK